MSTMMVEGLPLAQETEVMATARRRRFMPPRSSGCCARRGWPAIHDGGARPVRRHLPRATGQPAVPRGACRKRSHTRGEAVNLPLRKAAPPFDLECYA